MCCTNEYLLGIGIPSRRIFVAVAVIAIASCPLAGQHAWRAGDAFSDVVDAVLDPVVLDFGVQRTKDGGVGQDRTAAGVRAATHLPQSGLQIGGHLRMMIIPNDHLS